MRKTFCDHCGKEITGKDINELGTGDCFFDMPNKDFVGCGYTLCEWCGVSKEDAMQDLYYLEGVHDMAHNLIEKFYPKDDADV